MAGSVERASLKTEELFDLTDLEEGPVVDTLRRLRVLSPKGIHTIKIGGTNYSYFSQEAIEAKLLQMFGGMSVHENIERQEHLFNLIKDLARELKQGRNDLVDAQRYSVLMKTDSRQKSRFNRHLTLAKAAFAEARNILNREAGPIEPERVPRPEPEVPKNIAQPEELVEPAEDEDLFDSGGKGRPTIH